MSPSKPDRLMMPVTNATRYPDAVLYVLDDNRDVDTGDLLDQQVPVPGRDGDYPPAAGCGAAPSVPGGVFWPAWEFDLFTD